MSSAPAEKEWFEPGEHLVVINSQGWTFGIAICFDIRIPELFRASALHGAHFMLLPVGGSGFPAAGLKECRAMKRSTLELLPSRAIDNALYIFYTNAAGKSGSHFFPGVTLAFEPNGKLIGEHLRQGMLVSEMSRDVWETCRSSNKCTIDVLRPDVYGKPLIVNDGDGG